MIPPKDAVSAIVGKIQAHTSRKLRQRFPGIKTVYWRGPFWPVGVFSSAVKSDEAAIQRYVECPETGGTGQLKVPLDFGF